MTQMEYSTCRKTLKSIGQMPDVGPAKSLDTTMRPYTGTSTAEVKLGRQIRSSSSGRLSKHTRGTAEVYRHFFKFDSQMRERGSQPRQVSEKTADSRGPRGLANCYLPCAEIVPCTPSVILLRSRQCSVHVPSTNFKRPLYS